MGRVQGCRGAGVQGCRGAGVQGCRGAGVQGCMSASVHGWMGSVSHLPKSASTISKYVTKSVQLCKLVCPTVASRLCNLVNAPVLQYLLRVSPNVAPRSVTTCVNATRMFNTASLRV